MSTPRGHEKPHEKSQHHISYAQKHEEIVVVEPTLKEFVVEQVHSSFVENIPMETIKELPPQYMYLFGTLAYMFSLGIFIFFLYTNYVNTIGQHYIALDESGGTCHSVPIALTGTYMADTAGNWVGSPDFLYSKAAFSLVLSNFEVSSLQQYEHMMSSFQAGLLAAAEAVSKQNLALGLVYWMAYLHYYSVSDPSAVDFASIGYGQLQYLELTGRPSVVFNLPYTEAAISSAAGVCTLDHSASYDPANALLELDFNSSAFAHRAECAAALSPSQFSVEGIAATTFALNIDVRSFAIAMAVNYGIIQISDLGIASAAEQPMSFGGVDYLVAEYFDRRYSQMDPVLCIRNVSEVNATSLLQTQHVCLIRKSVSIATLPVFNHFGSSNTDPHYCDCGGARKTACDQFNLLTSLLYFKLDSVPNTVEEVANSLLTSTYRALSVLSRYRTYADFNRAAYNASFAAAATILGTASKEVQSAAWQKSAFSFCSLPKDATTSLSCSLATFHQFDFLTYDVSDFHYQLAAASCSNSVAVNESVWALVQSNPPAAISETYYECYPTVGAAMLNALGVASGNTSLAMMLFFLAVLPALYLILAFLSQIPPREEYSEEEKAAATELLSILLLRIRDGKSRGVPQRGVLAKLAAELIGAANMLEGEARDSDDEDDDDVDAFGVGRSGSGSGKSGKSGKNGKTRSKDNSPPQREGGPPGNGVPYQAAPTTSRGMRKDNSVHKRKLAVFAKQRSTSASPSSAFTDIDEVRVTSDLRILNLDHDHSPTNHHHHQRLSDDNVGTVVTELLRLFGEALTFVDPSPVSAVPAADLAPLTLSNADGADNHLAQRRHCAAFQQAKVLSARLATLDFERLVKRADKHVFAQLFNVLCMHASIELGVKMREVAASQGDIVAYNLGGKVLTCNNLIQQTLVSDSD